MKKMIFAAMLSLVMTSGSLMAQPKEQAPKQPPTVEERSQRQTERLTKHLALTEEQQKQVYATTLEQNKQMDALFAQMKQARAKRAEQMKQILTTEQFIRWAQMQTPYRKPQPKMGVKQGKGAHQGEHKRAPNKPAKGDAK